MKQRQDYGNSNHSKPWEGLDSHSLLFPYSKIILRFRPRKFLSAQVKDLLSFSPNFFKENTDSELMQIGHVGVGLLL